MSKMQKSGLKINEIINLIQNRTETIILAIVQITPHRGVLPVNIPVDYCFFLAYISKCDYIVSVFFRI